MPLAWEARLTPKEVSIFKTLYGEARINERIHAQLFRLILGCILKYKPGDVLCPRLIFQTYFDVMGFKSGSGEEILNCRLTRNGQAARPNTKLSYSQSLQDSKDIMKRYGVANITEKSFKASGVTALLDKKTSLSDVQVYGGWRSEQTPLFYHNSSVKRRAEISTLLLQ